MLPDVVKIFLSPELGKFFAIGVDHSYKSIVKVYLVIPIHQPHIICPMFVDITGDEVNIVFVFKHNIVKKLKGKLGEIHRIFSCVYNCLPFLLGDLF